jgi:hypothetical protein
MVPICDRLLDAGECDLGPGAAHRGLDVSPRASRCGLSRFELDVVGRHRRGGGSRPTRSSRSIPTIRWFEVWSVTSLMSDGEQEEATEMMIPAAEALLEKADYSKAQKMLRELVEISPNDERDSAPGHPGVSTVG